MVVKFGSSYLLPQRFGYLRAELILLGKPFGALRAARANLQAW